MLRHHLASLQGDGAPYILASRRQRGSWILHNTAPDKRVPCRTLGHQGLVLPRPAAQVHRHRAESLAVSDTDNLRKLLTDNDQCTTNVEHAVVLKETRGQASGAAHTNTRAPNMYNNIRCARGLRP